jgi:aryl-alcohol dehydrogenase-like predicted oxidoreductase
MGFGSPTSSNGPWVLDAAASLPLLKYAFDKGINTWDTADFYSQGASEEIIGRAIAEYGIPREKLVLLSKVFFGVDEREVMKEGGGVDLAKAMVNDGVMVNRVGLSRKHILDAVDASVKRLGTYIDVLQIHRFDRDVPPEEIMKALNDAVESGKVRYIGASSMAAWQFQMLNNVAEKHGWYVRPLYPLFSYSVFGRRELTVCYAGTSLSPCKTTTTSSTARKSAKCIPTANTPASDSSRGRPSHRASSRARGTSRPSATTATPSRTCYLLPQRTKPS